MSNACRCGKLMMVSLISICLIGCFGAKPRALAPMVKIHVPPAPKAIEVTGATPLRDKTVISMPDGKTIRVTQSGGAFLTKQSLLDMDYNNKLYGLYVESVSDTISEYNKLVESHNKSLLP